MSHTPQTLEGWYVLHDIRRLDRAGWQALSGPARQEAAREAAAFVADAERLTDSAEGSSALFSLLGHKGDLLILHLRPDLDSLQRLEQRLERLTLARCLVPAYSFVSVVELSQHAPSPGEAAPSPEAQAWLERRLKPAIPENMPYVCFYPMNKKRGEQVNWFTLGAGDRAELMKAHATTGRRYAGKILQVISGAMGLDDWEWGVTLFAADPLQFKKLVYEMRFDEVSAQYAEFGSFYVGKRLAAADLPIYLAD
jgi:hydrogen peroxide-dependent heme synthase